MIHGKENFDGEYEWIWRPGVWMERDFWDLVSKYWT